MSNAGHSQADNLAAAGLMMASMAAFTLNDAFMKLMAGDVPLYQLLFLRGSMTCAVVAVIAWRMGVFRLSLSTRDWQLITLRSFADTATAFFFLTALFNMPLANVTAILQALPLTITLAAWVFLGDPVGWRRLLAIAVGFIGVMLIIRPGTSDFSVYSLYGVAAVCCVTFRDLTTRRLSSAVPSILVVLTTAGAVTLVFGILSLKASWTPMSPRSWGLTSAAAVTIIGAYLFSIMVMRRGDISFVAPFRYTGLIWALLLGFLFFGDWPSPLTLIGAAIVVGSGLFAFYREARLGRRS
jgi:S-adenosylmethionine uptake transporter